MRWLSSTFAQAGVLLALAGVCALISNGLATPSRRLGWWEQPVPIPATVVAAPQPSVPPSPPADLDHFAADPAQPIREITSEEAWALHQARTPFLDARRSTEYAEGHIAGAWNVAVWESTPEAQITAFEAAAQPGSTTPLVLYCSGGDCEDSHLLATRLTPLGYRNLLIYRAGYPDWVKYGRPTGKGGRP